MAFSSESKINHCGYSTFDALLERLYRLKKESLDKGDMKGYRKLNMVIDKMKSNPDLIYCEDVKKLMKQLNY